MDAFEEQKKVSDHPAWSLFLDELLPSNGRNAYMKRKYGIPR
jgi:hypothetical protein